MSSQGSQVAPVSRPTWRVEACSIVTATSGSATEVTEAPYLPVVEPVQSRRKSRLRRRRLREVVREVVPVDGGMVRR